MNVGWVWRQPARLSAYGKCCGVRSSSQSGGLAKEAVEHWNALDAKHTQPPKKTSPTDQPRDGSPQRGFENHGLGMRDGNRDFFHAF